VVGGIAAIAVLVIVFHEGAGVLSMAPAFLLLAAMVLGRYPGEQAVLALQRAAGRARRVRPPRSLGRARRAPRSLRRAGSAVLATGLAVRPPPVSSVAV
jgi:hypothetical protein